MNDVITISDDTFDEAVRLSDIPVVVDFWAEWCGPCKVVAPILDEIASAHSGKLKVVKLNVDDNPRTAQRFQVMSIPTLLLFKNGETQARIVGQEASRRSCRSSSLFFDRGRASLASAGSWRYQPLPRISYDVGDDRSAGELELMSRPRTVSRHEDLLPLHEGDSGEAVVDLQERLERLGFEHGHDGLGAFGPGTAAAVQVFQSQRGLRVDGVCDYETWSSLVEAGFRLGDRLLYRRSPMLQGDDVADVQRRLSGLGFDPGGVDGIFGDNTHAAIAEFQRNMGLVTDGICGPVTLSELRRVAPVRGGSDLVTPLREQLRVGRDTGNAQLQEDRRRGRGGFRDGCAGNSSRAPPCRGTIARTARPRPSCASTGGEHGAGRVVTSVSGWRQATNSSGLTSTGAFDTSRRQADA